MTYVFRVLAGLLAGGLVLWLLASARAARSMAAKFGESERRANMAEVCVSRLEATVTELRGQNQKFAEEFAKARDQLAAETIARVKAEIQIIGTFPSIMEKAFKEEL